MGNEGDVVLIVERKGSVNVEFTVDYYTKDGSAVDGVKYISQHGTLVFNKRDC